MARTPKSYGTFTKDGDARVAFSEGEAVSLRFDGWAEVEVPTEAEARGTSKQESKSKS